MTIRPATLDDTSKLLSLEKQLFEEENFPLSYGSLYYHIKNNLLYVGVVESEIVAYILVLIKRKKAKIYSLGVLKEYRGRDISSQLLKTAISKTISLKFKRITLEVRTDNISAIALYEKHGFIKQKIQKEFYLDGCDAYIMEHENAV